MGRAGSNGLSGERGATGLDGGIGNQGPDGEKVNVMVVTVTHECPA